MRKLALTLTAAVAAVVAAAPAAAVTVTVPTVTFTAGAGSTINNGDVKQSFDSYATGTTLGTNSVVYNVSVTDQATRPVGASGQFLSVLANGAYTINFKTFVPVLSFVTGTLDAYNSVTLTLRNTAAAVGSLASISTVTYTGAELGTLGADGLVKFDTGSSNLLISGATFNSTQNSFEIDTITTAAPEPATWAMMILGFGFAGMGLRSRRRGKLALA